MSDLVSVIIPVYNAERLVRETLDSVINQTYTNIEVIVVDDGSTDNSPEICDSYKVDSRVKVFHRENSGLSASRQFGIDNLAGKYFVTVDSDDYVAEDFIEKLHEKISETKANICVCGRYDFIDGSKHFIRKNLNLSFDYIDVTPVLLNSSYRRLGTELVLSDSWNKMYDTEFVRNSGVKFELDRKYNGNDFAFNYKLILHCPSYCVLDEPLLYHRIVAGSMVHRKNKPLQESFEVIEEQLIQEAEQCDLEVQEQLGIIYYNLMHLVVLDITEYADDKNIRKKMIIEYINRHKLFSSTYQFLKCTSGINDEYLKKKTIKYTIEGNENKLIKFCTFFVFFRKIKRKIIS